MKKIKIFVSYSHKDTDHVGKDGLLGFLRGLENDGDVEFWMDDELTAGDRWDDTLKTQLQQSDIGLVLVSQAFLDSKYCMDEEMKTMLNRRIKEGIRIFPILLSPCELNLHPWITDFQCLPAMNETIEENYTDPGTKKRLYLKIRQELRSLIEQERAKNLPDFPSNPEKIEGIADKRNVTLLTCNISVDSYTTHMTTEDQMEFLYEEGPKIRDQFTSLIGKLEGFVVHFSGTGQMSVCFGYPNATELASVTGVRAGLELVKLTDELNNLFQKEWNARLAIKVGIFTGKIIGKTGVELQQELENGPINRIASSIMNASSAGFVLISDSTQRLVNGFFDLQEHTEVINTETVETIRTWKVLSDKGVMTRFEAKSQKGGLLPIVGRNRDLNMILEFWHWAKNKVGKFVVLIAEPGIGKSRIIEEVKNKISTENSQVFSCQCFQLYKNSPFFSVIKGFEHWLGIGDNLIKEEKVKNIEAALLSKGMTDKEDIAIILNLFSLQSPQYPMPDLLPKRLKEKTFEVTLKLLLESSAKQPMLLVFDDLQWIDPTSFEWLSLVFNELRDTNILILCATRPEFHLPVEWNSEDFFHPIKLDKLFQEEIIEMILEKTNDKSLPEELMHQLCQKTDGCPLFIEELTQMVIESGIVEEKDSSYVYKLPIQPLKIPDTLQDSLMVRLNNLEEGRIIAQIAAVIGDEFNLELIKLISNFEEEKLINELTRLIQAGILVKKGVLSSSVYLFKQALIEEAIYESMLKKSRKDYHAKIAKFMESSFLEMVSDKPEFLAFHFQQAENYIKSVHYSILACRKYAMSYANLEVSRHAIQALELIKFIPESMERNKQEMEIHLLHGPALLAITGWSSPEIGKTYLRAQELAKYNNDFVELAKITRGLWGYYMVSANLEESLKMAEELYNLGALKNDEDIILEAHAIYCDSYFWQGNLSKSLEHAKSGLGIYNFDQHHLTHSVAYGEDPSAIMSCYSGVTLLLIGENTSSKNIVDSAIDMLGKFKHPFSKGFLINGIAWYYMHQYMPEETLVYGNMLKKLAQENNFAPWLALSKIHVGWAKALLENMDLGTKEIMEGLNEFKTANLVVSTGLGYSMLTDAFIRASRMEEALQSVETGLNHINSCEERHCWSELLRQKAQIICMSSGDKNEAKQLFDQSLEVAISQGATMFVERTKESIEKYLK